MLCSRSASLTSSTRMSSDMASRNLRRFSAARWLSLCASILESLVTPSTSRATFLPNSFLISAGRRQRVLDRVVEDGGDDRLVVEMQVGEDAGHLDRMAVIGIARGAGLRAVRLHREDIGAVDQRLVGVRVVALDLLDQFILPQHRAKMGCGAAMEQRKSGASCSAARAASQLLAAADSDRATSAAVDGGAERAAQSASRAAGGVRLAGKHWRWRGGKRKAAHGVDEQPGVREFETMTVCSGHDPARSSQGGPGRMRAAGRARGGRRALVVPDPARRVQRPRPFRGIPVDARHRPQHPVEPARPAGRARHPARASPIRPTGARSPTG